jgi:hypothetical protein
VARYKLATPLEAFREGDEPAELVVELATLDGTPVSLEGITAATAELIAPDLGGYDALPVAIVGDQLHIDLGVVVLEAPGLWELEVVVVGASSSLAVEPASFVVEAKRDGWHTLTSARAQWADAPRLDISLYTFLAGAREQITAYAPELAAGARVPLSWQQAQLMQARNCWNAAKTDPATGGIGGDELVFRPYPMDTAIRYLLRPKRAIGAIA